jgi:hypothetical protein
MKAPRPAMTDAINQAEEIPPQKVVMLHASSQITTQKSDIGTDTLLRAKMQEQATQVTSLKIQTSDVGIDAISPWIIYSKPQTADACVETVEPKGKKIAKVHQKFVQTNLITQTDGTT